MHVKAEQVGTAEKAQNHGPFLTLTACSEALLITPESKVSSSYTLSSTFCVESQLPTASFQENFIEGDLFAVYSIVNSKGHPSIPFPSEAIYCMHYINSLCFKIITDIPADKERYALSSVYFH